MKNFELVKLTKQTAKTLIQRELNLSAAHMVQTKVPGSIIAYCLDLGNLKITVQNDWHRGNGRIELTVNDPFGPSTIKMLFHPDTLNRNFGAEEAERRDAELEARKDWVFTHGPEHCHNAIDRMWEGH